jgi:AcrR family transcriptional regulator
VSRAATPARRSQLQRRTDAERRLLDAAAELIGEVGLSGVTLAGVGERAGYSRGLASHYFGSKGALMQRLVEVVAREFREALGAASASDSPMDELLGLVRTFIGMVADLPPLHRAFLVLWADAVATSPDVRPIMAASDRHFRRDIATVIARGVASGDFPAALDAGALATVLVGVLRGIALQRLVDADRDTDIDLDASTSEIEQLLAHRLSGAPR